MIPKQMEFQTTGGYEYGKRIGEFMSSNGECIAYLKIGRFKLFLDVDGDAKFSYKRKVYTQSTQLMAEHIRLIRNSSPEIRWVTSPMLLIGIEVDGGSYESVVLEPAPRELDSPLSLKVNMVKWLVRELRKIDTASPVLTESERDMLDNLDSYRHETRPLLGAGELRARERTVHQKIERDTALLNVVALVETELHQHPVKKSDYLTIAWLSKSREANMEISSIAMSVQSKK